MKYLIFSFATILTVIFPHIVDAGSFLAFSMREAERRLKTSGVENTELRQMGGITRIAGMVYDKKNKDLIIIGETNKIEEKITLDGLVVAMRAVLVHNEYPYVSIDRMEDADKTDKLIVHFKGGISNTKFGKDMLEADVVLKKLSFGLLPSEIWGVRSYFTMSVDYLKHNISKIEDRIGSRFWFYPKSPSLTVRQGVGVIRELVLGVETRVDYAIVDGKPVDNPTKIRDAIGDQFADQVMRNLKDLSIAYPEIARLKILLDLTALAKAAQELKAKPNLHYWLSEYKVTEIEPPKYYDVISRKEKIKCLDNKIRELKLSGGIELNPIVLRLKAGDATALRDAVLKSRPQGNVLTWRVPLEGWEIPGALYTPIKEYTSERKKSNHSTQDGFSLDRQVNIMGQPNLGSAKLSNKQLPPPATMGMPKFDIYKSLLPQRESSNVGGVMLQGVPRISGSEGANARVDLTGGNFSLIVEGQRARLAPEAFRKFVTALWSVYYSKQDPGISIDPIAPGVDKHLVRYIGKVINNDLGRVMREADYTMKKWAVGTERPDIKGFKDVDDLMARYGFRYVGASRRFWFVPEDMKFKRGGDMLLFEDGRMTVKTEYVFQNKGVKAEPADEAFAKFFTDHYQEISRRYPIYEELFEYAKMVSLAKYLKEQGIPLFWFLMANKDLVITEDSPGTVDALAKGSDYFKGIQIEGGVDLGFQGNYVYDEQAIKAINEAISKLPATAYSKTTLSSDKKVSRIGSESFSFNLGKDSYTVIPQHSLTSGKDRRGIRYQTDLAFRHNGEPSLELVRYFNPNRRDSGEFGKGWHLLIPYRIKPTGSAKTEFLNAIIPEKMTVENLLTGKQEVLTFSTDRYSIAGYVPEKLESSQVIGLFIMSDASYRLADKLGNEFWFDQAGYLTDMIFSKDHHIHFEYLYNFTDAFEQTPYQVKPADQERIEFLNARIPKRMKVKDLINGSSEIFIFSDKGNIAGYIPENAERSRFKILALMSNASFRLLDKEGNEIAFSPSGNFDGMAISPEYPMVSSVSQGKHKVNFKYTMDKSGKIMIASANFSKGEEGTKPTYVVHYQYDDQGRLCKVISPKSQVAENHYQQENRVMAARR